MIPSTYFGSLPKDGCLRSNHFIMRLALMLAFLSLGRAFRETRPLGSDIHCLDSSVKEDFDFGWL
jgi:hypothetical protein